jgi:hypothetical protein
MLLFYNPVKLIKACAKHFSVCLVKVVSKANRDNYANVNYIELLIGKEQLFLV